MKKSKTFPWEIIIVTILFILISTFATYIIAIFFKYHKLIPQIGSINDWIGFAGSIFGGSITMIALFFTILHERKTTEQTERFSIRPMLFCEITNNDKKFTKKLNCVNNYDYIKWEIKNISNNIADKVRIIDEQTSVYDHETNTTYKNEEIYNKLGVSVLTVRIEDYISLEPQGKQALSTNFLLKTNEDGTFKCKDVFTIKNTIIIECTDYLGKNTYKNKFDCELVINIDNENKPHIFILSTSNTLLDS